MCQACSFGSLCIVCIHKECRSNATAAAAAAAAVVAIDSDALKAAYQVSLDRLHRCYKTAQQVAHTDTDGYFTRQCNKLGI